MKNVNLISSSKIKACLLFLFLTLNVYDLMDTQKLPNLPNLKDMCKAKINFKQVKFKH